MLITFEGPDGSGKSTQITLLANYLRQQGYRVAHMREPGGTRIGEQIREVLHSTENTAMTAIAEVLLYSASRAQLVGEVIRPALDAGEIVLCDRFYDSTLAYQGYGRGLDLDMLHRLTEFATGGLRPDLTIYLDLDPDEGLRRRQQDQGAEWNRLDAAALEFHEQVREGYRVLLESEPERWVVVDGSGPVDDVQTAIRKAVDGRLAERSSTFQRRG